MTLLDAPALPTDAPLVLLSRTRGRLSFRYGRCRGDVPLALGVEDALHRLQGVRSAQASAGLLGLAVAPRGPRARRPTKGARARRPVD